MVRLLPNRDWKAVGIADSVSARIHSLGTGKQPTYESKSSGVGVGFAIYRIISTLRVLRLPSSLAARRVEATTDITLILSMTARLCASGCACS